MKVKDFEDGIIGNDQLLLTEYVSVVLDGQFISVQTDIIFDFRIIIDQGRAIGPTGDRGLAVHIPEVKLPLDPIDSFGIRMEPIIAQLILYPQPYHQARGQTDGQAGQIYQRIQFVSKHVSECDFEVIFKHSILREIIDSILATKTRTEKFLKFFESFLFLLRLNI